MIYFDENKNAYAYKISNPVATTDDDIWKNYAGTIKWDIIDGVFTDVTATETYKTKVAEEEKNSKKKELNLQIEALDLKRIRAVTEPQLKDGISGQTWLEYYTKQIQALRTQIAAL